LPGIAGGLGEHGRLVMALMLIRQVAQFIPLCGRLASRGGKWHFSGMFPAKVSSTPSLLGPHTEPPWSPARGPASCCAGSSLGRQVVERCLGPPRRRLGLQKTQPMRLLSCWHPRNDKGPSVDHLGSGGAGKPSVSITLWQLARRERAGHQDWCGEVVATFGPAAKCQAIRAKCIYNSHKIDTLMIK
jgi:hypothetical protein